MVLSDPHKIFWIDPRGRPQSRPVVIIIFTQSVRPFVPKLQNQATITAGRNCGLAEWINDDSCLVVFIFVPYRFLQNFNFTNLVTFLKKEKYKTCVINDPLGQTRNIASSELFFVLHDFKKWGRMICVKIVTVDLSSGSVLFTGNWRMVWKPLEQIQSRVAETCLVVGRTLKCTLQF